MDFMWFVDKILPPLFVAVFMASISLVARWVLKVDSRLCKQEISSKETFKEIVAMQQLANKEISGSMTILVEKMNNVMTVLTEKLNGHVAVDDERHDNHKKISDSHETRIHDIEKIALWGSK